MHRLKKLMAARMAGVIRKSWAQYPNYFADDMTPFHTLACLMADEFYLTDDVRTEFLLSCVPDNQKPFGQAFGHYGVSS